MIDFLSRHASQHDIAIILRLVYHSELIFGPVQTKYSHTRYVLSRYQRSDGRSHLHTRHTARCTFHAYRPRDVQLKDALA